MFLPAAIVTNAMTLDDIGLMIKAGDTNEALAAIDSIASAQPKNAVVDLLRGECLVAMGDDTAANTAFESANRKGSNDALLGLADIAVRRYLVDDADGYIEKYRSYLKKNRRKKLPDESGDIEIRINRTRAMLDRVEKIAVIDSLVVDEWQFFEHYRLSPESGSLNSIDVLPMGMHYSLPTVVYQTEDRREMIWAAQDSADMFVLRKSDRLVGDSWGRPVDLGADLGGGGDANYPFLMPDGVTLYFASDGDGSLGGYDIYISRYDGSEFLQPQNIGMPYNSPYNDYMLAIDETSGVGWWATDRNRLDGQVTIYVFIPAEMRINVDIDDPSLIDRARLTSIRSTWEPEADYSNVLSRVASIIPASAVPKPQFRFAMPDGSVLTRLEQFSTERGREAMERYLSIEKRDAECRERLDGLRADFASGDQSVSGEILDLERQLIESDSERRRVANDIIKAEAIK